LTPRRNESAAFEDELTSRCLGASAVFKRQEAEWHLVTSSGLIFGSFGPWRLLGPERILVTTEDHGHRFGLPEPVDAEAKFNEHLRSATIERVTVDPVAGDLAIEFSGSLVVQIPTTSAGYESWKVNAAGQWVGGGASGGAL
jgi:hypothetical protein